MLVKGLPPRHKPRNSFIFPPTSLIIYLCLLSYLVQGINMNSSSHCLFAFPFFFIFLGGRGGKGEGDIGREVPTALEIK